MCSSKPNLPWRLEIHHFSSPSGRLDLKAKALLWLFWLFKSSLKYLQDVLSALKTIAKSWASAGEAFLSCLPLFCSLISISFLHSKAYEELIGTFCHGGTDLPVAKIVFLCSFKGSWLFTEQTNLLKLTIYLSAILLQVVVPCFTFMVSYFLLALQKNKRKIKGKELSGWLEKASSHPHISMHQIIKELALLWYL